MTCPLSTLKCSALQKKQFHSLNRPCRLVYGAKTSPSPTSTFTRWKMLAKSGSTRRMEQSIQGCRSSMEKSCTRMLTRLPTKHLARSLRLEQMCNFMRHSTVRIHIKLSSFHSVRLLPTENSCWIEKFLFFTLKWRMHLCEHFYCYLEFTFFIYYRICWIRVRVRMWNIQNIFSDWLRGKKEKIRKRNKFHTEKRTACGERYHLSPVFNIDLCRKK